MCWIQAGVKAAGVLFAKTGVPDGDDKRPKTWWVVGNVLSFDGGPVDNAKDAKLR